MPCGSTFSRMSSTSTAFASELICTPARLREAQGHGEAQAGVGRARWRLAPSQLVQVAVSCLGGPRLMYCNPRGLTRGPHNLMA